MAVTPVTLTAHFKRHDGSPIVGGNVRITRDVILSADGETIGTVDLLCPLDANGTLTSGGVEGVNLIPNNHPLVDPQGTWYTADFSGIPGWGGDMTVDFQLDWETTVIDLSEITGAPQEGSVTYQYVYRQQFHGLEARVALLEGDPGESALNLDQLSDVEVAGALAGQLLRWNGSSWQAESVGLDDLFGVSIVAPAEGDVLTYTSGVWVADEAPGGGGGTTLAGLSDVTLASLASGQLLHYNGSEWENVAISALTIDADTVGGSTATFLRARANHTGTQAASTIFDFNATTDARIAATSLNTLNGVQAHPGVAGRFLVTTLTGYQHQAGSGSVADLDDLSDVDAGSPTAGDFLAFDGTNWTPTPQGTGSGLDADTVDGLESAHLLARANHTGTQASSTIASFNSEVNTLADSRIAAADVGDLADVPTHPGAAGQMLVTNATTYSLENAYVGRGDMAQIRRAASTHNINTASATVIPWTTGDYVDTRSWSYNDAGDDTAIVAEWGSSGTPGRAKFAISIYCICGTTDTNQIGVDVWIRKDRGGTTSELFGRTVVQSEHTATAIETGAYFEAVDNDVRDNDRYEVFTQRIANGTDTVVLQGDKTHFRAERMI